MPRCSCRGMLRSGSVKPHLGVADIRDLPRVPPIMPCARPWRRPPLPAKRANRELASEELRQREGIPAMTTDSEPRYVQPDRGTRVFNSAVAALTRAGISVCGSRVLAVRGRTSGQWRTTPVNPLTLNGERYLVAPRGETQWVRNM